MPLKKTSNVGHILEILGITICATIVLKFLLNKVMICRIKSFTKAKVNNMRTIILFRDNGELSHKSTG